MSTKKNKTKVAPVADRIEAGATREVPEDTAARMPEKTIPENKCFKVVDRDHPPVQTVPDASTLYGIKEGCSDVPRLLRAILDELIARRFK